VVEVGDGLLEAVARDVHHDGAAAALLLVVVIKAFAVDADVLTVHTPLVRVVAVLYAAERLYGVSEVEVSRLRHRRVFSKHFRQWH